MSASPKFILFVANGGPIDLLLETTLKAFLGSTLKDVGDFVMVNVVENPELFEDFKVLTLPTLIKLHPMPVQRFVGDLLRIEELAALLGLEYQPQPQSKVSSDVMRK